MHPTETELNDYADGALATSDVDRVRAHIAQCDACAREIEAIVALQKSLGALPDSIMPETDLRARMWAQIDDEQVTPIRKAASTRFQSRVRLASAAVLLIAASSAITVAVVKQRAPTQYGQQRNTGGATLVSNDARSLELRYDGELEQLQAILQKSRGRLAPETVRILSDNLAIIDNAIGEAKAALVADPNSDMLVDLLRSAYERKVELLRQAAKSSPST